MSPASKPPKRPLCFAVVPPGFEGVMSDELRGLGFQSVQMEVGGVSFRGDPLRANRSLACATRILYRVGRFPAPSFQAFEKGFRRLDLSPFGGITPQASTRKSKLYHTGAIEERVTQWCTPGPTPLLIRMNKDKCTVSIDTSGERLHRRGWRLENGPAPMRETLAACLLRRSGWTPGEALYDPMCGSGTFLIEAAIQAAGRLPGEGREFACESWWTHRADPIIPAAVETIISGSDQSAASISAAQANAKRAGVECPMQVNEASLVQPMAEQGLLIANPPYGKRARDVGAYDALGQLLSGAFKHWRAAVVISSPAALKALRAVPDEIIDFNNGGIRLKFGVFSPQEGE